MKKLNNKLKVIWHNKKINMVVIISKECNLPKNMKSKLYFRNTLKALFLQKRGNLIYDSGF